MTKFYLSLSRYLAVLLLFITTMAWSQSRTVTGTVTSSDDGSPLPGVNIIEKGTNNGTATDANGNYSLNVSDNATLVFSFVGYTSQEVAVGGQSAVSIALQADVTALSEVVVIGYGEVSKRDATGAVTSVKADEFQRGVISSPEQLIQGKTAGVQITTTSGAPGAGVQLRIRGTNSIRSNNNPLFVVDGVPLSGGTQPQTPDVGYGTISDTNPLNFINPSDIESINILKDASATAIYGSRGANGVVIITTKRGKGSKGTLEASSSISIARAAEKYDLLGPYEFIGALAQFQDNPSVQNYGYQTDWQEYILRTSVSNKQNISYSRGFNTASIRASLGYENQQGIIEHSYQKRLTGKVNGSKSFLDNKLNIDLSATVSNVKREDPPISANAGSTGDLLGATYMANPTWPADPTFNPTGQRNPANMLENFSSEGTTNRIITNLSADYKITSELTAKATYGMDWSKGERTTLLSGNVNNVGDAVSGSGLGQLNENKTNSNLLEVTLNYDKTMGNIVLDVVGGYSVQSFHNKYFWATGRGFEDYESFDAMESALESSFDAGDAAASALASDYNNWGISDKLKTGDVLSSGGFVNGISFGDNGGFETSSFERPAGFNLGAMAANFFDQTDYLQSYFGRANVTISEKYLFTATLRADGSSKFGSDNRYGIFPSAAAAWRMDQEDFMPETFSTFKVRLGYGVVGNQDGLGYGEFIRRERFTDASINNSMEILVPGSAPSGSVNPALKWESTTQFSGGIDFGILEEKLTGSIDYYVKNTTDLLLKRTAAQPSVATQIFDNLDATVQNKGWELSLNYQAIQNTDASVSISGNVSHNKNEVKDFAGVLDAGTIYGQGLSGAYAQRLANGQPLFSYFLREFEGFDQRGQPIGDVQKFIGKSALPTWNAGLSLTARYKAIDFSMYMVGQFGHYIYSNTRNAFFTAGSIQTTRNVTRDVLGNGEAGNAEASVSTRFLESGDFIRCQTLTLGYAVPTTSMKFVKNLRVYFNAQNLFLITDYSGLDPEVSSNPADSGLLNGLPTAGIDYVSYPRPRTYTFGLNVTF